MKKQIHLYYTGRVQGIGFRFTAEAIANELRVCGWVKNLSNGKVEVLAEADDKTLDEFLSRINKCFSSYIQDVDIQWNQKTEGYKYFTIEF